MCFFNLRFENIFSRAYSSGSILYVIDRDFRSMTGEILSHAKFRHEKEACFKDGSSDNDFTIASSTITFSRLARGRFSKNKKADGKEDSNKLYGAWKWKSLLDVNSSSDIAQRASFFT